MDYEFPSLIVDASLKRLHVQLPKEVVTGSFPEVEEHRKRCNLGEQPSAIVPFTEAVRLFNEEGYRPCGNCLQEDGEISNWRERAETAETRVQELEGNLDLSCDLEGCLLQGIAHEHPSSGELAVCSGCAQVLTTEGSS